MSFEFNRIIGGFSWPGDNKPGSGVVVGEDAFPEIGGRIYHCHLLAEIEDDDTGQLLRKSTEMKARFKAGEFYGRYDESNMNFLTFWNKDARNRRVPEFHVYPAPASEEGKISYHLNILRDRLRSGRKTLHFSEHSKLPGYLRELPTNRAASLTDSQYPAVAALGYAVSVLTLFEPDLEEDEEVYLHHDIDPITGY